MPCRDERDNMNSSGVHYMEEASRLGTRCRELTELLCEAGRARADKRAPSKAVRAWWKEHSQLDCDNGKPWDNPPR